MLHVCEGKHFSGVVLNALRVSVVSFQKLFCISFRFYPRSKLWMITCRVLVLTKRLHSLRYNSVSFCWLDSLRWFSQRRSPMPHFWGFAPRGDDPQIRTPPKFLYNAPNPQVSSSYVYSFGSYRLDKQTNKQTNRQGWKHRTLFATLRRWVKSDKRFLTNCNNAVGVGVSLWFMRRQMLLLRRDSITARWRDAITWDVALNGFDD